MTWSSRCRAFSLDCARTNASSSGVSLRRHDAWYGSCESSSNREFPVLQGDYRVSRRCCKGFSLNPVKQSPLVSYVPGELGLERACYEFVRADGRSEVAGLSSLALEGSVCTGRKPCCTGSSAGG